MYDDNKKPSQLLETETLADDDVFIVQKDGESIVKRVKKSNTGFGASAGWVKQEVQGVIDGANTNFTIAEEFEGTSMIRLGQTILLEDIDYTVSGTDIQFGFAIKASFSGKDFHIIHG